MTCGDILHNQTFYLTQLLSWNPTIHATCKNLPSMLNRYICISPPGSDKWNGNPSSTSILNSITFKVPPTSFGTLPVQTPRANYTTSYLVPTSYPPVPIVTISQNETANSILSRFMSICPWGQKHYEVGQTYLDAPENCTDLLAPYCFPVIKDPMPAPTRFPLSCYPDGYQLNATITSSSVSSISPIPTGVNRNCTIHYTAKVTDTCQHVVETYVGIGSINFNAFLSWNPLVGANCALFSAGIDICIGVHGATPNQSYNNATATATQHASSAPTQSGIISACAEFYVVPVGGTCQGIVNIFNNALSLLDFTKWNPAVGSGCNSIWAGKSFRISQFFGSKY
jgi:hypothetical protein